MNAPILRARPRYRRAESRSAGLCDRAATDPSAANELPATAIGGER